MRPPQNAGEIRRRDDGADPDRLASMRPPQNAGEIGAVELVDSSADNASMRPPQNAGEIAGAADGPRGRGARFNEAPAKRGGNLWVSSCMSRISTSLQ